MADFVRPNDVGPVPDCSYDDLLEALQSYVDASTNSSCFSFGVYNTLSKSQAVRAKDLADLSPHLLIPSLRVQPAGRFKPSMIESIVDKLLTDNPEKMRQARGQHMSDRFFAQWATTQLLIIFEHTRRMLNEKLFKQATKHLTKAETQVLTDTVGLLRASSGSLQARSPASSTSPSKQTAAVVDGVSLDANGWPIDCTSSSAPGSPEPSAKRRKGDTVESTDDGDDDNMISLDKLLRQATKVAKSKPLPPGKAALKKPSASWAAGSSTAQPSSSLSAVPSAGSATWKASFGVLRLTRATVKSYIQCKFTGQDTWKNLINITQRCSADHQDVALRLCHYAVESQCDVDTFRTSKQTFVETHHLWMLENAAGGGVHSDGDSDWVELGQDQAEQEQESDSERRDCDTEEWGA